MANIQLHESETYRERLPDMCMACGEPAVDHIRRNFSWCPPWVGVLLLAGALPYIIVASITTKRMLVEVPVCDRHRGYFWKRNLLMWLPLLLIGVGGIGLAVAAEQVQRDASGIVCGLTALLFIAWLIAAVVIQSFMIKPTEITERSITLKCVHERFADAVRDVQDDRDARRRRRFEDEDYDERPRRPLRDDYDDERPRRDRRTDIRPEREFEE